MFRTTALEPRGSCWCEGAGNDLDESRRAMEWMRPVLAHPDWRPENLPRIRDLGGTVGRRLRATMQGSEEAGS